MTRAYSGDEVVRRFLEDKLELIKLEYRPVHLIVFGSRARGTARAGSDIDLVIVSERFVGTPFPDRMGDFLNVVWPSVAVDAICYTPEEFEELSAMRWPFLRNAMKEGIRVE